MFPVFLLFPVFSVFLLFPEKSSTLGPLAVKDRTVGNVTRNSRITGNVGNTGNVWNIILVISC